MKNLSKWLIAILLMTGAAFIAQKSTGSLKKDSNYVKIEVKGNYRYITSNGIPDHNPGQFPNSHNPNRISPQRHRYRVKSEPEISRKTTQLPMGPFGVALNGVPFDPLAAEFWQRNPRSGWQYEALSGKINLGLDRSNAHVQPNGAYHYHGLPTGMIALLGKKLDKKKDVMQIGYAADGFPIYSQYGYSDPEDEESNVIKVKSSYRIRKGSRPDGPFGQYDGTFVQDYEYVKGAGDLDECNGRFGVTPEYPEGIYHYYLTETYPFIPRLYRGTPDQSFRHKGPPGGPGRRPGQGPPGRRPPFRPRQQF